VIHHDGEAAAPELFLLKAEDIPTSWRELRESSPSHQSTEFLRELANNPTRARTLAVARGLLRSKRSWPAVPARYTAGSKSRLPQEDYEEYDTYFGVTRVEPVDRPVDIMALSIARALFEHIYDAEQSGLQQSSGRYSADLVCALNSAAGILRLGLTGGDPTASADCHRVRDIASDVGNLVRVAPEAAPIDALLRWRRGHQVFFVLMQGLILSANLAIDAIVGGDISRARFALATATACMDGAGAALRYAGDFSPTQYARTVRPAMGPPLVNPRFSGLQARDHRVMLNRFQDVRLKIDRSTGALAGAYARFRHATAQAYAAHKFVCARFGGSSEPSLRMAANSTSMASETLERIGRSRLEKL
jgi:hypothetical protein